MTLSLFISNDLFGNIRRKYTVKEYDVYFRIRIGVLTGPAPLIDTFRCNIETSVQHTSGLSQVKLFVYFKDILFFL